MAILWCGGEDISFPNIPTSPTSTSVGITTTAPYFRSGYSRGGICSANGNLSSFPRSNNFPGGVAADSTHSCWFTLRAGNWTASSSLLLFGLVKDSTSSAGLYVGTSAASASRLGLFKFDGTGAGGKTQLAAETGNSLGTSTDTAVRRIDVQLINYGAAATVNVYVNLVLILTYGPADVTVSGVTSLSAAAVGSSSGNIGISEMIVSSTDTRSIPGLVTLALTGAGTTNSWAGSTYTNINGTTASDLTPTSSNTTGQNNEYNVTDLPSGIFAIEAVMVFTRASVTALATPTQIKMGYLSGGSVGFGTGAAKTPSFGSFATFHQLDTVNPVTGVAWVQSEMNALQLDFQSA